MRLIDFIRLLTHAPLFPTDLSERWHRVALQQAAGIAQSWRTNRANAYQSYADEIAKDQY